MTNPFAPQPAAPAPAPVGTNPFGPATPVEPAAPAPAPGNPFGPGPAAPPAPYAPPAPAYVPPSNPPAPAPAYGQPASNGGSPWPAGAQAAPPPTLGRAAAPAPPSEGGGRGAKLPDMYGKLCIVIPTAYDPARQKNAQFIKAGESTTQRQMTVTFVVIDDGTFRGQRPIEFGGKPYAMPPTPHNQSAPLPYINKGVWINQTRMIDQLMPNLPGGPKAGEIVVGRPFKTSPEHNAPWYLSTPTHEELVFAQLYLDAVAAGHLPHPLA
jgi:hypothetical protein